MSYISSLKWRSFSFYNNNYRKSFLSGRNGGVAEVAAVMPTANYARFESFWRKPIHKKNYSLRQKRLSQV